MFSFLLQGLYFLKEKCYKYKFNPRDFSRDLKSWKCILIESTLINVEDGRGGGEEVKWLPIVGWEGGGILRKSCLRFKQKMSVMNPTK